MSFVSCTYCGGLHKRGEVCAMKNSKSIKKDTAANTFRNTHKWRKKAETIKKRDNYLCQCCLRNLHNTLQQYNFDNLSVHHIVSIHDDYTMRLDEKNLITLCSYHHSLAERGKISKEELQKIAREQIEK